MIYLDNTATTFPKPQCVVDEMCNCIKKYCGNPGRSAHALSIKSAETIYNTRVLLAEMFNAEAENVIFTYNTTYALNIAIKGYIKYSSHILISDMEHNSVLRPVHELSVQKLCTYNIFSTDGNDEEILDNIKSKLQSNTKMLICTHVSNICSRRLPIEEIGKLCKEKGIFFIVDGAQSAGVYDINVKKMHIDALCIPGHKSLYGPQGVGAIIFETNKVGRSVLQGGTGINSLDKNMPDFLPEAYEAGTLSTPTISGLFASIKWLKTIGTDKIRKYEEDLYDFIYGKLIENDYFDVYKGGNRSGNTLSFNIKNFSSVNVSNELDKRGICVRSGFHCAPLAHKTLNIPNNGAVRIGISVFNTKTDLSILYDSLVDIAKQK